MESCPVHCVFDGSLRLTVVSFFICKKGCRGPCEFTLQSSECRWPEQVAWRLTVTPTSSPVLECGADMLMGSRAS